VVDISGYCTDGTGAVSSAFSYFVTCVNLAGTENCDGKVQNATGAAALGGATFSVFTFGLDATPTNAVNVTLNATCSLAQTTLVGYWAVSAVTPNAVITAQ